MVLVYCTHPHLVMYVLFGLWFNVPVICTERHGFYFKYSEHRANIDDLQTIMKFTDNESRVDF